MLKQAPHGGTGAAACLNYWLLIRFQFLPKGHIAGRCAFSLGKSNASTNYISHHCKEQDL
jgi:hypothetical protein